MNHGNLILHNIVDVNIFTEMNPSSTVYDSNGNGCPCPAFNVTKIRLISTTGEAFEVQAFRSDV